MREEVSAGGVVVFGNAILLLRKYNGDWVLPKGRVEEGEELVDAAKREVKEETGVKTEVIKYLGEIHYTYKDNWDDTKRVHKIVHWYMMKSSDLHARPQKEEGFIDAKYIPMDKVVDMIRYDDEREIVKVAVQWIKTGDNHVIFSNGKK
ncbi:MAG: NUDIX hydrolase [Peptostreptococcaceae bacterium]|nr:NUDIX hydrolase [Peptostreptococcaceae bacterium]